MDVKTKEILVMYVSIKQKNIYLSMRFCITLQQSK